MLEELTMVLVTILNVEIKIDPAMKQTREYTQMNHTLDPVTITICNQTLLKTLAINKMVPVGWNLGDASSNTQEHLTLEK